jgi:hypothetical protein
LLSIIGILEYEYQESYILALSNEQDMESEADFHFLEHNLSNDQLTHLLSHHNTNPILGFTNVRFYLALIAVRRGLNIANTAPIDRPSFFASNNYTGFANPLFLGTSNSYGQFLDNYQSMMHSFVSRKPFYDRIIKGIRAGELKPDKSAIVTPSESLHQMSHGEKIYALNTMDDQLIVAFEDEEEESKIMGYLYTSRPIGRDDYGRKYLVQIGGVNFTTDKMLEDNWYRLIYPSEDNNTTDAITKTNGPSILPTK